MRYATLSWIKPIIDQGLQEARKTLEQFVETENVELLRPHLTLLRESHGTLVMLNAQTAALLLSEIMQMMHALVTGKISNQPDIYDSLMRALLQLANYLDYLVLGYPDIPLALLPIINRLRHARLQPVIQSNSLFLPDIYTPIVGLKPVPPLDEAKFKQHCIQLRAAYHQGLNAWLKGQAVAGLKLINTVLLKLQQLTGNAPVTRIWLIAGALLEAMLQKGLPANAALAQLFKQIDSVLQALVNQGRRALQALPAALVTQMLFYVAHSKSAGARVTSIKNLFCLNYLLPSPQQLQTAQEAFAGPDIDLIAMLVKEHIKEDMDMLQTTLDIIQRTEEVDINELAPLIEVVERLAYTLRLLGLDSQCEALLEQARLMKSIVAGKVPNEMSQLLTMAFALLHVDAALETLIIRGTYTRQQIQKPAGLMEVGFNEVVKVVVEYAKKELLEMKEPIKQFISSGGHLTDELTAIPRRFKRVQGVLVMLSKERANKLMSLCNHYVQNVFIKQRKIPPEPQQQALADAITSFEVYLETLAGNPMDGEGILLKTQRCLLALR